MSSINIAVQQFLVRRHRRRHFQLRYLQDFSTFYLHLRAKSELACRQRRTWVFPRPHNWLQQLLNNDALDHWWKQNLKVSRNTFEYICQLIGQELQQQNTRMRGPIPVNRFQVGSTSSIKTTVYFEMYDNSTCL